MIEFKCPVCGKVLLSDEKSFACSNGHLFDRSKYGYVNLILDSSNHGHGDASEMLGARTDFLEKGYYNPFLEALIACGKKYIPENGKILDAGSGEGFYSEAIKNALSYKNCEMALVDISKDGMKKCGKRFMKKGALAVASVYALPFFDDEFDAVYSVFSPLAGEEFKRVIKKGGKLIRTFPLEEHLFSLKKAVYDEPYKNSTEEKEIDGFEIIDKFEVKYMMNLASNEDIKNLFAMTPYSHKTSRKDAEKLDKIEKLLCEAQFGIYVYEAK